MATREKEENVPFSLKIDISEIFFTWNRSGVLGFYFNLLSNFSWIFQKNINYIIKFLSAQPLKTFRLIFLMKSLTCPNSHIFVRPKRVWLFGYVRLFGLWLLGGSIVSLAGHREVKILYLIRTISRMTCVKKYFQTIYRLFQWFFFECLSKVSPVMSPLSKRALSLSLSAIIYRGGE